MFCVSGGESHQKRLKKKLKFGCACLDIGAQRTCIGLEQDRAHFGGNGSKWGLKKSKLSLQFGDKVCRSLSTKIIRIPTSDGSFITVNAEVVKTNMPILIAIGNLDKEGLIIKTMANKVQKGKAWSIPITRRGGHIYIKCK